MAYVVPTAASSPRKIVLGQVLVRNTFIEVNDGEQEQIDLDNTKPVYRRRRGSSFFRSSSAPLTAGRLAKGVSDSDECTDVASTQDFGSDSEHTHVTSYVDDDRSSRSQSPSPEHRFEHLPLLNHQIPTGVVHAEFARQLAGCTLPLPPPPGSFQQTPHESALAAAVNAGFNAGMMAAAMRSMQIGHQPVSIATAMSVPAMPVPAMRVPAWTGQQPRFAEVPRQMPVMAPVGAMPQEFHQECSSRDESGELPDASHKGCHLIWCDHRAFKDTSAPLREQLQNATGLSVKTHRTAENCLRLLRKKRNASGRPPCVFLVSLANAPALLAYLTEASHVRANVIVLAETRRHEAGTALLHQYPMVTEIAKSWQEAVEAASRAIAAM